MAKVTYLESLRAGLHQAMSDDSRVFFLGEDVLDPYGGAFKVSQGLSTSFPDRVLTTPISESAIAGVSTGMSIRGFKPVAEIMFGDFLTLCTDQLLNSATKFPLMYGQKVSVPIVIRTPMGGGRGYGPTHSQSIEKMFLGIPGLKVVSPSLFHEPGSILRFSILNEINPVLFIEYKTLYPKKLIEDQSPFEIRMYGNNYPVAVVDNFAAGNPDVTVVAYGGASLQLAEAMSSLEDEEIRVRGILPSLINGNCEINNWIDEVNGDSPVIIAEHGTSGYNWGSHIASMIYESKFRSLKNPVKLIASKNDIVPSARHLEEESLLNTKMLINEIVESIV